MPTFISEDQIEAAMLQHLQLLYGYDALICFTADPADLNDGSGRTDKREVILYDRLRAAVIDLNNEIPGAAIDDAMKQLCDRRAVQSAVAANREVDDLIRNGVPVEFKDATGRTRTERVRIIDFKDPAANQFLAVSQLWVLGERGWRRPDLLLYINGLPLVFIELKNAKSRTSSCITRTPRRSSPRTTSSSASTRPTRPFCAGRGAAAGSVSFGTRRARVRASP